jgi:hypothetical protein
VLDQEFRESERHSRREGMALPRIAIPHGHGQPRSFLQELMNPVVRRRPALASLRPNGFSCDGFSHRAGDYRSFGGNAGVRGGTLRSQLDAGKSEPTAATLGGLGACRSLAREDVSYVASSSLADTGQSLIATKTAHSQAQR